MHRFIINDAVYHAWGNSFRPIEQAVIEWAEQFLDKKKTAVDVGAHVGDWAVGMSPLSNWVMAFEAQKATYNMLRANANLYPNIICHNVALSNKDGHADLHIPSADGGGTSLNKTPYHDKARVERATLSRFDDYGVKNISLVKLDVEGHEREVIEGMVASLRDSRWPRLIFEAWSYPWFAEEKERLFRRVQDDLKYTIIPINWPDMYLAERRA